MSRGNPTPEQLTGQVQRLAEEVRGVEKQLGDLITQDLIASIRDRDKGAAEFHIDVYQAADAQVQAGLELLYKVFPRERPLAEVTPEAEEDSRRIDTLLQNSRVQRGKQGETGLKLSFDRKVSPVGVWQRKRNRWVATVPNSFGLPAGISCPGRTSFCDDCYGIGAEQNKGVKELLEHNYGLLLDAETVDGMTMLLTDMVAKYAYEARRINLAGDENIFRIHWDGDFFSQDYAKAWAVTMQRFPEITFWAYTRSFRDDYSVVDELIGVPNLVLYLSVDDDNIADARELAQDFPQMRLAYCSKSETGAERLHVAKRKQIACPENVGTIALMNDGKGACVTCRVCPDDKADVVFLSHGSSTST